MGGGNTNCAYAKQQRSNFSAVFGPYGKYRNAIYHWVWQKINVQQKR